MYPVVPVDIERNLAACTCKSCAVELFICFHLLFYSKEIDVRVVENDFAFRILSFALRSMRDMSLTSFFCFAGRFLGSNS